MAGLTTQANVRNLSLGGDSAAVTRSDPRSPETVVPGDGDSGLLRVISNEDMVRQEEAEELQRSRELAYEEMQKNQGIAGHIRERFHDFRKIRETRGISIRLAESLRAFRGQYSEQKLQAIQQFGGSDVYARLTALKCRGATAILRDIYMGGERPWFIQPTPDPTIPDDIASEIDRLIQMEASYLQENGQLVDDRQLQERREQLMKAAKKATMSKAVEEARTGARYLDDMLVEGGFYDALIEFLHNLTVFPYAIMKGPVVKMATDVKWVNGEAQVVDQPRMYWTAPSPFDLYWNSGQRKFEDADVIEHIRLSRHELNNLIGVPGYDEKALREVLNRYGQGGLSDWLDYTDTIRAKLEQREDPHHNLSDLLDTLEFHGKIQGKMLRQHGFSEAEIPDPDKDYHCTAWLIDYHLIRVQLDPNPRKRHPFYLTSFDKVPGSIVGHGIPEIIHDIQDVANATLRSLVNNLSISSGPQVVVNDDRLSPNQDGDALYPWKRWHVISDPMSTSATERPIDFFQPNSNANELLGVMRSMWEVADEISAIPRYMTGSDKVGGAGETASGLSMLMQNASKVLQSVAANVDNDIFKPLLRKLYETVLLTDRAQRFKGDENIQVRGVSFAAQREQERARLLEFLQMTANPIDMSIIGTNGRAELLREISKPLNLDHRSIVPDSEELAMQQQATMQDVNQAQGQQTALPPAEAGNVDEGVRALPRGPSGQAV